MDFPGIRSIWKGFAQVTCKNTQVTKGDFGVVIRSEFRVEQIRWIAMEGYSPLAITQLRVKCFNKSLSRSESLVVGKGESEVVIEGQHYPGVFLFSHNSVVGKIEKFGVGIDAVVNIAWCCSCTTARVIPVQCIDFVLHDEINNATIAVCAVKTFCKHTCKTGEIFGVVRGDKSMIDKRYVTDFCSIFFPRPLWRAVNDSRYFYSAFGVPTNLFFT